MREFVRDALTDLADAFPAGLFQPCATRRCQGCKRRRLDPEEFPPADSCNCKRPVCYACLRTEWTVFGPIHTACPRCETPYRDYGQLVLDAGIVVPFLDPHGLATRLLYVLCVPSALVALLLCPWLAWSIYGTGLDVGVGTPSFFVTLVLALSGEVALASWQRAGLSSPSGLV